MQDEEELELLLEEYDNLMATVPVDVRRRLWLLIPNLLESTAEYTWTSNKCQYELETHYQLFSAVISTKEEFERIGRWWIANSGRYRRAMGLDAAI